MYPKIQVFIIFIAVILLSLLYFFYPASNNSFHPNCPFNQLTGYYCPGCGSQRAASALLHGHLLHAMDFNILFVCSIPFVLYSAGVFTWNAFSDRKVTQRIFYSPVFVKVFFVLVVLFFILRNIPAFPFTWLAP